MKVVVETEAQYKTWLEQQDAFYVDESNKNNESQDEKPVEDPVTEPVGSDDQTAVLN